MSLVVDCSVASAWALVDERTPWTSAALKSASAEGCVVPTLFWFELRNTLIVNERRGRIDQRHAARFLALVEPLIDFDTNAVDADVLDFARTHSLSVYDASYLELARRLRLSLCTLDRELIEAAAKIGVTVWQP